MKLIKSIKDLDYPQGVTTGFVPTMGAFHEGHLQLMRTAKRECDRVIVSLFVNPTQFGAGEDFERYPRNLDRDCELAESTGVDILFAPSREEIYPRENCTVHVPEVTDLWEGAARPTHFDGVSTVVCKLFNIVRCDVAYFGQKDLQQCLVIQRMIEDLNMPVRFSRQATVREADGLAMSSRNVYLSPTEREIAPNIYKTLHEVRSALIQDSTASHLIESALTLGANQLTQLGFVLDYFDLIDLETAHPARNLTRPTALIVAGKLGKTRLIDNLIV